MPRKKNLDGAPGIPSGKRTSSLGRALVKKREVKPPPMSRSTTYEEMRKGLAAKYGRLAKEKRQQGKEKEVALPPMSRPITYEQMRKGLAAKKKRLERRRKEQEAMIPKSRPISYADLQKGLEAKKRRMATGKNNYDPGKKARTIKLTSPKTGRSL